MFLISSGLTQLNSSLSDNYGGTNNKFRFATDGAGNFGYLKADDSFAPFSGSSIKSLLTMYLNQPQNIQRSQVFEDDGTYWAKTSGYQTTYKETHCFKFSYTQASGAVTLYVYAMKDGYYAVNGDLPIYKAAGDTIYPVTTTLINGPYIVAYLGETAPTSTP